MSGFHFRGRSQHSRVGLGKPRRASTEAAFRFLLLEWTAALVFLGLPRQPLPEHSFTFRIILSAH